MRLKPGIFQRGRPQMWWAWWIQVSITLTRIWRRTYGRLPPAFTVNLSWGAITCPAGSHGYNAIARTCDPRDDHYHGTHVSGTVGAAGNNATGVAGVNWTTRIMGLKFLDSSGSGSTSNAIDAIEFAIQVKARFAGYFDTGERTRAFQ